MRIKPALWIMPLMLFAFAATSGVCLAQSGVAIVPESAVTEGAQAAQHDVLVAVALPQPADTDAVRTEDAVDYSAESAPSPAAEPLPASSEGGVKPFSRIGFGVKFSTLGVGIDVATPLARKFNVRGGFNMMRYTQGITNSGIHYDGHLQFQSAEAHLDWFPIWGLHVSPGLLFYNGNQITGTASVPGGQTFSVGGTTYESDPATPVTGTAKLDFVKVSPTIMVGVGNLIPRSGRHYSFLFEVGAAYQGSARVALNLAGNVCDTSGMNCQAISSDATVQANIQAQQVKLQNDVNPYRFYPVISLGVGFNF